MSLATPRWPISTRIPGVESSSRHRKRLRRQPRQRFSGESAVLRSLANASAASSANRCKALLLGVVHATGVLPSMHFAAPSDFSGLCRRRQRQHARYGQHARYRGDGRYGKDHFMPRWDEPSRCKSCLRLRHDRLLGRE